MERRYDTPLQMEIERLSYRSHVMEAALVAILRAGKEQGGLLDDQRDELLTLLQGDDLTDDPSAARLAELRSAVADVLEEMFDPDEGLEVAPEIRERLLLSLDTPAEELLTPGRDVEDAGGVTALCLFYIIPTPLQVPPETEPLELS